MEDYKKYLPARMEDINPPEKWRPIPRFNGTIEASNIGCIRSLNHLGEDGYTRILAQNNRNGYLRVKIKGTYYGVHNLVWEAFHGEIPVGMEIDHRNSVPSDNRLLNLRICTHKENMQNQFTLEKIRNGQKKKMEDPEYRKRHYENLDKLNSDPIMKEHIRRIKAIECKERCSKKVNQYDLNGNFIREWNSLSDVNRELGYSLASLSECCNGTRNKAYNCIWSYEKRDKEWFIQREEEIKIRRRRPSKPVNQYDLNDNLIKSWYSGHEIQRELGFLRSNIVSCCNGTAKTAYGFIWRWKEEGEE